MARCFSTLRGKCVRVTRLDGCCTPPDAGTACSLVETKGFVTVSYSAEIETGQEITVRNANGDLCISDRSCDQFKRWNLSIEFCEVDPDLFSMIAGLETEVGFVNSDTSESVGFRVTEGQQCANFALELWTGIPSQDCDQSGAREQFGYVLLPCVTGGTIGDFSIENDAITMTLTGFTKSGSGWGIGPYRVVRDGDGVEQPLQTAIARGEHMLLRVTDVAPPCTADTPCGCQEMPEHARAFRPTGAACVQYAGTLQGNVTACSDDQPNVEIAANRCATFVALGFAARIYNENSTEDALIQSGTITLEASDGETVEINILTGAYTGAVSGTATASGCDTTTDTTVEAGSVCTAQFSHTGAGNLDEWYTNKIRAGSNVDQTISVVLDSGDGMDEDVVVSGVQRVECAD